MKYLLFIFSVLLLVFVSCKKDKTTDPQNNSSGQPAADGSPTNSTNFSGFMEEMALYYLGSADTLLVPPTIQPRASFTSSPGAFMMTTPTLAVDSVFANNVRLHYDVSSSDYSDTTYSSFNTPLAWKVISSNSFVPSFTYTNTNTMPVYTGYPTLPDTIKNGKAFTLNLTGLSNYSKIVLIIMDGNGAGFIYKTIPSTSANVDIAITASEAGTLTPGSGGVMYIVAYQENGRVFGGKNIDFVTELAVYKDLTIN